MEQNHRNDAELISVSLNTKNSNLGAAYGNDVQTASPWLYHELSMTRVLRKHIDRKAESIQKRSFATAESVSVLHHVDMSHFPVLDMNSFFDWLSKKMVIVIRMTCLMNCIVSIPSINVNIWMMIEINFLDRSDLCQTI